MYSLGYLLIKKYIAKMQTVKGSASASDSSALSEFVEDRSVAVGDRSGFRMSVRDREELQGVVVEGIRWLRMAAENGVVEASYQLGRIYQQVCFFTQLRFA